MSLPRLLDLYCGEGGSAAGYILAGFDVTGVDIRSLGDRFPGRFIQGDALEYLARHGGEYDAIHASPPCQRYGAMRHLWPEKKHPDVVRDTRAALEDWGQVWVMENVPNSPLVEPITLCGSMFGLETVCLDGNRRQLRRHRLFESPLPLAPPGPCAHSGLVIGVYGGSGGQQRRGYHAFASEGRQAMGIDWMTRHGLAQAIPPAYTQHVGKGLLAALLQGVRT